MRFGAREGEFELLIQIFGRKSNVYVVVEKRELNLIDSVKITMRC